MQKIYILLLVTVFVIVLAASIEGKCDQKICNRICVRNGHQKGFCKHNRCFCAGPKRKHPKGSTHSPMMPTGPTTAIPAAAVAGPTPAMPAAAAAGPTPAMPMPTGAAHHVKVHHHHAAPKAGSYRIHLNGYMEPID